MFFWFKHFFLLYKQSWQQRNRIKTNTGWIWLTIPVVQNYGQSIAKTRIHHNKKWNEKHLKSIFYNYNSASFFNVYKEILEELYRSPPSLLIDFNIRIILWICDELGIHPTFIRSSALSIEGSKTEHLLNICTKLHADTYLSPIGSSTYIEKNNLFENSDVLLQYQHFDHPHYHQIMDDFIPYLSTLDLLLNQGPVSMEIIRSGRKDPSTSKDLH